MSWVERVTESTRKPTRQTLSSTYVPPHLRYGRGTESTQHGFQPTYVGDGYGGGSPSYGGGRNRGRSQTQTPSPYPPRQNRDPFYDLSSSQSSSPGDARTVFPDALILSPTKELASKIYEEVEKFAYQSGVKVAVVCGGVPMAQQLHDLEKGVDILVATPGRLVDMIERSRVSLKMIKYLAVDDRMLDMGFEPEISKIVRQMDMPPPGARQTLLFSATFPNGIKRLASELLQKYIFSTIGIVGNGDKIKNLCGLLLKYQREIETHERGDKGITNLKSADVEVAPENAFGETIIESQEEFLQKISTLKDCIREEMAKGTTNIAFMTRTGITAAVDSRTWRGQFIDTDLDTKFYTLSERSNLHCTAVGLVRKWNDLFNYVSQNVQINEILDNEESTTASVAKDFVLEHLRNNCQIEEADRIYGTLLVGWPRDKPMEIQSIHIAGNQTYVEGMSPPEEVLEEPSFWTCGAILGTGSSYAYPVMIRGYDPDMSDDDAADTALEGLFAASLEDKYTGGLLLVYHIGRGTCVEKLRYSTLDAHRKFFGTQNDKIQQSIFLIQPRNQRPISLEFLGDNWPYGGEIESANCVAVKRDFYAFRVVFATEEDATIANEGIMNHQLPVELRQMPQPMENSWFRFGILNVLPRVVFGNPTVTCYVPKRSKAMLYFMSQMADDQD